MSATERNGWTQVKRYYLRNIYGWCLCYVVRDNGENVNIVTLVKTFKGMPSGSDDMTREEARQHYAAHLNAGFISPNTKF